MDSLMYVLIINMLAITSQYRISSIAISDFLYLYYNLVNIAIKIAID